MFRVVTREAALYILHAGQHGGRSPTSEMTRGRFRVGPLPLRGAHVHGRLFRQRIRQFVQQGFRILPTDAGIGDRDPVFQWFVYFPGLLAWFQIAFQQQPQDVSLPLAILFHDGMGNRNLARVIFVGIPM